jgi:DNA-binding winged helix-turn-helix (wHTH) protein
MIYRFGPFQLDTDRYELREAGALRHLEPQVFGVLAYLIGQRERVVPKEELLDRVWGHRFVGDATLSSRIMAARKAIGDSGREQRLIRTTHGRGFRFVGEVQVQAGPSPERDGAEPQAPDLPLPMPDHGAVRAVGR